ncbi:ATP-binding cassette domain-containing protein [Pontibacillus yanchengensis]|uniref:ATP-binding cassette domain-containing protein n=1 Tax=Pontibacillus yanchengensis TaxID=462910 RepID=A0ACC7VJL3_9BACI|nr:ABC transporter ATP-binding protein [Pontibacillus yanchengensis]MYL54364.1 ATP-binding cassette domain-containing protein [Pontibacillus yanchengensis]
MKTVLRYVLTYKKSAIIALLLMGVELTVELLQPMLMGVIIDQGVVEQDMEAIMIWGGLLLFLSLLAFASGITNSFFAANVSQGVGHDVRRDLFTRIQSFTADQFQRFATSSLITRMTNDVTQVQSFLFMAMRIMLRAPLFIIGGLILAFTVHAGLASILLLAVPFLFLFMLWMMGKGVRLFREVQVRLDAVNRVIRENLVNMRLIKAFDRGDYEQHRFDEVNRPLMDENKKALRLLELTMPAVMLAMNIVLVVVLWYGAADLRVGDAQAGQVVAVLNYGTRIMFSFSTFSFLLMVFSRGRASTTRIAEVLHKDAGEEVDTYDEMYTIKGDVSFEDVSFRYPGMNVDVIKHLSFSANAGETIGILGETGSGKTSLLQLLPRLYSPTEGQIRIDQKDIHSHSVPSLRRGIGFVTQEAHLFSGTIADNIRWGDEQADMEQVKQAAQEAHIHDFIMSLPNQYETNLGQKGVNLSGGQKQRLSLARAMIKRPAILLLDDSTSALDAQTETSVLHTLEHLSCTTFIVAQKISSVQAADHILLLQDSELIAKGTHSELMQHSDVYNNIFQSQLQREEVHDGSI